MNDAKKILYDNLFLLIIGWIILRKKFAPLLILQRKQD